MAQTLPRLVPDSDRSMIYEFAMDTATAFRAFSDPLAVPLTSEPETRTQTSTLGQRIRSLFGF